MLLTRSHWILVCTVESANNHQVPIFQAKSATLDFLPNFQQSTYRLASVLRSHTVWLITTFNFDCVGLSSNPQQCEDSQVSAVSYPLKTHPLEPYCLSPLRSFATGLQPLNSRVNDCYLSNMSNLYHVNKNINVCTPSALLSNSPCATPR